MTISCVTFYRLPPAGEQPCRFVKTYRGGTSPVEAVYAGIGSEPLQDDIVPFRQVYIFYFAFYLAFKIF